MPKVIDDKTYETVKVFLQAIVDNSHGFNYVNLDAATRRIFQTLAENALNQLEQSAAELLIPVRTERYGEPAFGATMYHISLTSATDYMLDKVAVLFSQLNNMSHQEAYGILETMRAVGFTYHPIMLSTYDLNKAKEVMDALNRIGCGSKLTNDKWETIAEHHLDIPF